MLTPTIEEKKEVIESDENIDEYYENVINKPFFKRKDIKWRNLIIALTFHIIALYGFITFPYFRKKELVLWSILMTILGNFGVTGGSHRYWSHRAFKATVPLKIIMLICFSISGHYPISWWIRDHRVHHKYVDTNADPHNSNRGFLFSHIGWLCMKKHPKVIEKQRQIDLSDVYTDPFVRFGDKYYYVMWPLFCFVLPTLIPVYFWGESWYYALLSQVFMRYVFGLNTIFSVNSFAHMFGSRPYDKKCMAAENKIVSFLGNGEGWHNYHHTFPMDYKAAEFGKYDTNLTALFLDLFAKIGWAYDLKQPSKELVNSVILNRGDGSHPNSTKTKQN